MVANTYDLQVAREAAVRYAELTDESAVDVAATIADSLGLESEHELRLLRRAVEVSRGERPPGRRPR